MALTDGLLNQKLDIVYSITKDQYGDTTKTILYTDVTCRFHRKAGVTVNEKGDEVRYNATVWLPNDYVDVITEYRIMKDSVEYKVMFYEYLYDISGNLDHIKLYLE